MATIFSGGSVSPFPFHTNKGTSFTPKGPPTLHLKRFFFAKLVASIGTEPSLSPTLQTFWKWLQEKGVITAKTPVKAGVVTEGLGLVAVKDISRNDVILQVPKRLWINPDAVEASEIGKVCSELKQWLSVILFLIRERSRAFSRLRNKNLVIVPMADLINHSSRVTTEEQAYEVKGAAGLFSRDYLFSLRSPLSVKAGEHVYIQYDLNKSNTELALDYDIAESNGFAQTSYFDIFYNCTLPPGLLPYLRLVALGGTDAFLLESLFRDSIWGHLELFVRRDNEELLCREVRDACKYALAGYHTTIEKDCKMKKENLDSRLAIAVGIREGEKMVLQQIDDIFKQKEQELDQLEYYQERRLNDLGLCGENGDILGDLGKFF
ncbi:hypothetical protein RYX36_003898 [Vicia faba]